jgi:hypothetical protein
MRQRRPHLYFTGLPPRFLISGCRPAYLPRLATVRVCASIPLYGGDKTDRYIRQAPKKKGVDCTQWVLRKLVSIILLS